MSKINGNGNRNLVWWTTIAITLGTLLVGTVLYVSEVKATTIQNRIAIEELKLTTQAIFRKLDKIERRQLYMMQHAGIDPNKIPE